MIGWPSWLAPGSIVGVENWTLDHCDVGIAAAPAPTRAVVAARQAVEVDPGLLTEGEELKASLEVEKKAKEDQAKEAERQRKEEEKKEKEAKAAEEKAKKEAAKSDD